MVWVWPKRDEPLLYEFIDDALHTLPVQPHVSREPRHRLGGWRERNGTEHLPARTGETKAGNQFVARCEEAAVEAEDLKEQVRCSIARMTVSRLAHGAN